MVAISPALSAQSNVGGSYFIFRQFNRHHDRLLLFAIMSRSNEKVLKFLIKPLVALSFISAALVLIISGIAFRWIQIGGLSFQPAELIKFTIVIVTAFFHLRTNQEGEIQDDKKTLMQIGIGLGVVAFIIVFLERDLGSMVVMTAIVLP